MEFALSFTGFVWYVPCQVGSLSDICTGTAGRQCKLQRGTR